MKRHEAIYDHSARVSYDPPGTLKAIFLGGEIVEGLKPVVGRQIKMRFDAADAEDAIRTLACWVRPYDGPGGSYPSPRQRAQHTANVLRTLANEVEERWK